MDTPPTTINDIVKEAQNNALYKQLLKQIEKDFLLANQTLQLNDTTTPTQLKQILTKKIAFLIQEDFNSYINLLYIVDVLEKEIKQINQPTLNDYIEQITLLILKRIWKKVWYKNYYQ